MSFSVTIHTGDKSVPVPAEQGQCLSDVLGLHRPIDLPCGGRGKCMRCRVRARGELSPLSEEERRGLAKNEIESGVRLACMARLSGDAEIWFDTQGAFRIKTGGGKQVGDTPPQYKKYGVAVDIGTTTVCAELYGEGALVAAASMKNPQTPWGSDVISRIEHALAGEGAELAEAVREGVGELIKSMSISSKIVPSDIDTLVIAGNTTMLYLLTQRSPEPLSHAPFEADCLFGMWREAGEMFPMLAPGARVYFPPCVSAFVGADITAAALASGMCRGEESAMLVDIGTNGEIALWHNGRLFTSSTAAGPAFEGSGLSCGSYGVEGAVDGVWLDDDGAVRCSVIGGGKANGICGSGVVDALFVMVRCGAIDETGAMEESPFVITGEVSVSVADVRSIQLAKSAIRAGLETLRISAGLQWDDIETLYVAGGFGSYLNLKSACAIGLLPGEMQGKIKVIGNAALGGASMILEHEEFLLMCEELARMAEPVALDANPVFMEQYVENMMFEEL